MEERNRKLRTKSAALHRRLKSEYLKAGHKTHAKAGWQQAEGDLDLEIAQNFTEDIEGEDDCSYDGPANPPLRAQGSLETGEEARLEKEAEELCSFMERLDMSKFLEEMEAGVPGYSTKQPLPPSGPPAVGAAANPNGHEESVAGKLRANGERPAPEPPLRNIRRGDLDLSVARPSLNNLLGATLSQKNRESTAQEGSKTLLPSLLKPKKQRILSGILRSSSVNSTESGENPFRAVHRPRLRESGGRLESAVGGTASGVAF